MSARPGQRHWDRWYGKTEVPIAMGVRRTYRRAVEWLDLPDATLEDWGGGTGYAQRFVSQATYRLVDGSQNAYLDERAELTEYRSQAECILIRHVLEHNLKWRLVLDNAALSFTQRLAVVLFTPLAAITHDVRAPRSKIPSWSFALADLEDVLTSAGAQIIGTETHGPETILFITRT